MHIVTKELDAGPPIIQCRVPIKKDDAEAAFDVTFIGLDSTNYQIFGNVTSTTAPAFADQ